MLPANPVVVHGTRSAHADAHRHSPENLLSCEAAREDYARPRHPYAPPLFCDPPPRSGRRCPDDPDAPGPPVARYHHAVPPDHPAASGDDPQPIRPPALRGPTPAPAGVTPCDRIPPPAQVSQPGVRPALHRGKSPISSAFTGRRTVVTIPYHPYSST